MNLTPPPAIICEVQLKTLAQEAQEINASYDELHSDYTNFQDKFVTRSLELGRRLEDLYAKVKAQDLGWTEFVQKNLDLEVRQVLRYRNFYKKKDLLPKVKELVNKNGDVLTIKNCDWFFKMVEAGVEEVKDDEFNPWEKLDKHYVAQDGKLITMRVLYRLHAQLESAASSAASRHKVMAAQVAKLATQIAKDEQPDETLLKEVLRYVEGA